MPKLREMKWSAEALNKGLRENALRHRNYNMYTAMDRAMGLVLTGNLYISNGQRWNDMPDRVLMKRQNAFGICMSCSTVESMAMWMLYSGEKGRNGALVQFSPQVVREIMQSDTVGLGKFSEQGQFAKDSLILHRENGDFEIYMTDVLYTDAKEGSASLKTSLWEDHEVMDWDTIHNANIFHKHYAWSYERECRLIVVLSDKFQKLAEEQKYDTIRIHLSNAACRSLKERIVRSPIYEGKTDFGRVSTLCGEVDWKL